jgi:hypothetical protein
MVRAVATQDRRHVRAQQATRARRRNELRRSEQPPAIRRLRSLATGLLQAFERMLDQRPVKNRVNRTSKTQQFGIAAVRTGESSCLARWL